MAKGIKEVKEKPETKAGTTGSCGCGCLPKMK